MTGESPDDRRSQNPQHISHDLPEIFIPMQFGMAANSPDPEARQKALGRLRDAGYSEQCIQAYIARWHAAARLLAR